MRILETAPDAVVGVKFDRFELDRKSNGHWHMYAEAYGLGVQQDATHMTPATIYNFSIRAAQECIKASMRGAETVSTTRN